MNFQQCLSILEARGAIPATYVPQTSVLSEVSPSASSNQEQEYSQISTLQLVKVFVSLQAQRIKVRIY